MKVEAQYEALGIGIQKGDPSRPVRHGQDDEGTGRSMAAYAPAAACERAVAGHFYRPWTARTSLFSIISQHFVLSYFRWSLRD
jgi:hypothetical protein